MNVMKEKNTKLLNFRLRLTNYVTDHTVFVGTWLKNSNLVYKRKFYEYDYIEWF